MAATHDHDVLILGASISSTALASVLARNGLRVMLLDDASHPRFAIGESMLPQTSMWMWIVGARFGVPELQNLSHSSRVQRSVSHTCGVKRAIGFVYHRAGVQQDPDEKHQLIPPETPLVSESHLFRQDTDHYLLRVAQKYGADYRENCVFRGVAFDDEGASVILEDETSYRCRFVVDGLGGRSFLAQQLNLREEPTRLRTNTRSIFNHFMDVPPFDEVLPSGMSRGWHEGTLHHVFDGGWFWVIPFGNHECAENRVCSVGLMLRNDRHPRTGESPEQEFKRIIGQFPAIERHMEKAVPVRNWVASGRIQYTASRCVGPRYALLSNTYAFVDPLYSTGLLSTFESLYALAGRLIDAVPSDDFALEHFSYLERLQRHQIDEADRMVHIAYRAMGDYRTWHAWTQLWLATVLFGDTYVFGRCLQYLEKQDPGVLDRLEESPGPKSEAPFAGEMNTLLASYDRLLTDVERGRGSYAEAAEAMLSALRGAEWLPKSIYDWGSVEERSLDFNPRFRSWLSWGATQAPMSFRKQMFNFDPSQLENVADPGR